MPEKYLCPANAGTKSEVTFCVPCLPPDAVGFDFFEEGFRPSCAQYWLLQSELARVHEMHGFVILYDCHSIRSRIPFLFDDTLPDFNIGTNMGSSCDLGIEQLVSKICSDVVGYTSITNGRFKGGWTTRRYGRPKHGYHAIQMELAQSTYMSETPPWDYFRHRAETLRVTLMHILETLSNWRPS